MFDVVVGFASPDGWMGTLFVWDLVMLLRQM